MVLVMGAAQRRAARGARCQTSHPLSIWVTVRASVFTTIKWRHQLLFSRARCLQGADVTGLAQTRAGGRQEVGEGVTVKVPWKSQGRKKNWLKIVGLSLQIRKLCLSVASLFPA